MFKRFLYLFPLLLTTGYLLLINPSQVNAFSNLVNYQGRAFDGNNKFVADKCYPVAFKIGRFSDKITTPTGNGTYTQTPPVIDNQLRASNIYNTHPEQKCPQGEVYVKDGLFNALLDLKGVFTPLFFSSTAQFYGISVSFNGQDQSLWQPFVTENWYYPANQNNSPQSDYYLSSHNTGSKASSWGLSTNHGFYAAGGLGTTTLWLMGNSAGNIQAVDPVTYNGARPLKLNANGGNVEIGDKLCLKGDCRDSWPTPNDTSKFVTTTNSGVKIISGRIEIQPETLGDHSTKTYNIDYTSAGFTQAPIIVTTVQFGENAGGPFAKVVNNPNPPNKTRATIEVSTNETGVSGYVNWIAMGQ